MRTTLTLDADVSVELEAMRRKQGLSLKEAVNDALRRGLRAMAEGDTRRSTFVTRSVDLGLPRLPIDDVAEAVAAAEGESFR
jgi:Arc/MetJ family transcription regulator